MPRRCRCCCCTVLRGEVICGPMFDLVVVERHPRTNNNESAYDSSSAAAATRTSLEGGAGAAATPPPNGEDAPPPSAAQQHRRRHLDVIRTFSPRPRPVYIALKIFLAAWILAILATSVDQAAYPSFWLAYLTHWGYTFTAMYSVMSPICAIYLALRPPPTTTTTSGVATCLAKTTWALLALVVPVEITITILFWLLEYHPGDGVSYVSLMVHGGTAILLLLDGFVLSRIPLRLKQFIFFESFSFLYLLWNVVHAISGIGNPYDGVTQDDDAIYSSLDWNTAPAKAIIMSVLVLLVANPIIFGICWWLSRLLPLRLSREEEEEDDVVVAVVNHDAIIDDMELREPKVPVVIH